jgi:hypothetical protein
MRTKLPSLGRIITLCWNRVCCKRHSSALSAVMSSRRKTILSTAFFAVTWIVAVLFGLRAVANYENTPGEVGVTPALWPAASRIPKATDRATLVMFAHPRCPCTGASMAELAQIMAQVQGKVSAYVVFLKPANSGPDWDDTDLRHSAAHIPGVTVVTDVNGTEARRFGAETSGHTLVFGIDGRRLFDGGITASRGHAGDNLGQSAIVALLNNHAAGRVQTHVFGCSLIESRQMANKTQCSKQKTN